MKVSTTRKLVTIHRWAGIALCVPLVMVALSGTLLLFRDSLWVPAEWRAQAWDMAAADGGLAAALDEAGDWSYADVARPGRAFHTVGFDDGRAVQAVLVPGSALQAPPVRLAIELWLFDLHTRLWLGEGGRAAVRVVGPAAFLSVVIGLVLWWPRRRTWRAADLARGPTTRPALIKLHLAWGGAVVIVLLPLVLSGALMAHNPTIRAWLKPLSPPAGPLAAEVTALRFESGDLAGAIAAARAVWPDGQLTQLSRPPAGATTLSLKFRLPGERHPNGRSTISVDLATGAVTALRDARRGGIPAAYDDLLYGFHIAELGGTAQAWAWFAGGAGLLLLAVTGLVSWWRRPRRARNAPGAAGTGPG